MITGSRNFFICCTTHSGRLRFEYGCGNTVHHCFGQHPQAVARSTIYRQFRTTAYLL